LIENEDEKLSKLDEHRNNRLDSIMNHKCSN